LASLARRILVHRWVLYLSTKGSIDIIAAWRLKRRRWLSALVVCKRSSPLRRVWHDSNLASQTWSGSSRGATIPRPARRGKMARRPGSAWPPGKCAGVRRARTVQLVSLNPWLRTQWRASERRYCGGSMGSWPGAMLPRYRGSPVIYTNIYIKGMESTW
jgi:hypothetical protein